MNKEQIIEAIKAMSVLELNELVRPAKKSSAYPLPLR